MRTLPVELYRAAQVRELDRIAIEERGIPGYTLMNRAGEAAFHLLRQRWPKAWRIEIVCGGGNNGGDGYVVARLARHRLWLVGGTLPLRTTSDANRVRAACLLFNDQGQQVARYDKVHLFDVQVVGSAERHNESATIEPGDRYQVADTPLGRLGLAVCYDLRFPEQFRCLVEQGMEIMVLPAAFTATTGRLHWEILLRARAIENQCYVIAAGQGGVHVNGRETYGDSLIIDPWGVILNRQPWGPGVALAQLDRELLEDVRRQFPVLQHRVRFETVDVLQT